MSSRSFTNTSALEINCHLTINIVISSLLPEMEKQYTKRVMRWLLNFHIYSSSILLNKKDAVIFIASSPFISIEDPTKHYNILNTNS